MTTPRKLLLSAAFALAATPAFAADIIETVPTPPVAIEVPFTWTGAYVGAQIGYVNANINVDVPGLPFNFIADADGIIGGVHAGYNFEIAGFVAGVYADIDASDATISLGAIDPGIGNVNYIARGMVKVGYAYDRALAYVQGGVAHIDADFDNTFTLNGQSDSDSETGYVVGAGVDFAVTDNIIVGGDYLYHNFDGLGETDNILGAGVTPGTNAESDVNAHTFRAKFAYKF